MINIPFIPGVLEFKSPVLSSAGTFGYGIEYMPYGDITRLGALITNSLTLKPSNGFSGSRYVKIKSGLLSAIGEENQGVEHFIKNILPRLPWKEVPVIPNISGNNIDELASVSNSLSTEQGIAAIEINLASPNDRRNGQLFCQNPVTAARAVSAVKKSAGKKPVIAKLFPQSQDIVEVARAVEAAGADAITCVGRLRGMAVDLETKRPILGNIVGGLASPALKPLALRHVWQVAQEVNIPIIGAGGITCTEDVLEFILVGASAVSIGSANFKNPQIMFNILDELPELCKKLNIDDLASFRNTLIIDDTIHRNIAYSF